MLMSIYEIRLINRQTAEEIKGVYGYNGRQNKAEF